APRAPSEDRQVTPRAGDHDDDDHDAPPGGTLHLSDLYLACACAHDVPGAVPRVLAVHQEAIAAVARRLGLSADARDDLAQLVGERLFVAAESGQRRIARYSGAGPLRAWMKAVATRVALDLVRRQPRD